MTHLQSNAKETPQRTRISRDELKLRQISALSALAFLTFGGLQFCMAVPWGIDWHKPMILDEDAAPALQYTPVAVMLAYCGWMLAFIQAIWAIAFYSRLNLSEDSWGHAIVARGILALLHWLFWFVYQTGQGQPNWLLLLFAMWAWFDVVFIAVAMNSRECANSSSATRSDAEIVED